MAGQPGISPQVAALLDRFNDLDPVMEEIGEQIVSSMLQNFRVGGRYGNDNEYGGGTQTWIPSQRAIAQNGQTLVDSAQSGLRDSIGYAVDGNAIVVGTNKVYGAIHNFGGQAGRNKSVTLPARPWAVLQDSDLEEIEDIITHHYTTLLNG